MRMSSRTGGRTGCGGDELVSTLFKRQRQCGHQIRHRGQRGPRDPIDIECELAIQHNRTADASDDGFGTILMEVTRSGSVDDGKAGDEFQANCDSR